MRIASAIAESTRSGESQAGAGDYEALPLSPPRTAWEKWYHTAGFNRAAVFGALSRVWLLMTAPVTLLLIARYFTLDLQGYYYTFASLVALQTFVELGFYLVIINVASHEWSRLALDDRGRIVGDAAALSRLVSLGRLVFKWYGVATAVFVVVVGVGGYVFLSMTPGPEINWQGPWVALVLLTGLLLWTLPFNSLLEGCNQVETINRFRLSQAITGTVAMWVVIGMGGGLWAAPTWAGVNLARDLFLLLGRYRHFFEPFCRPAEGPSVRWGQDIWPLQWRLGLSGMVNYFAFSLFTPVMFHYHGPATAGQMGMTLAAVTGLQSIGVVWVQSRAPLFGILVAKKDYAGLDRLFWRVCGGATGMLGVAGLAAWGLLGVLTWAHLPIADRVLAPLPTLLFLLAALLVQVCFSLATYLRAHKQEPFALLSVACSAAIGLFVWLLGARYGPVGAGISYLGGYIVASVWGIAIWKRCRARWHLDSGGGTEA